MVGVEVRLEILIGALSSLKKAMILAVAAVARVLLPALAFADSVVAGSVGSGCQAAELLCLGTSSPQEISRTEIILKL
jgi:Na+/H+ antiporter NhaA